MSALAVLRRSRGLALRAPGLLGPEVALVALADGLFWGRDVGLSLPAFCAAAAALALWFRPGRRHGSRDALAVVTLLAALAPAIERPAPLSSAFALAGTAFALGLAAAPGCAGLPVRLRRTARDLMAGPRRVIRDVMRRRRAMGRRRAGPADARARWVAWIAPLGLLGAFGSLLAEANPLVALWMADLPFPTALDVIVALPRGLFWLAVLVKVWPLVRARRFCQPPSFEVVPPRRGPGIERLAALLLSPAAVLRALVPLCGAVGLQLGLDGAYLWGGLALPRGLSYAAYAHRGAYPLVATALGAGAVALAIRRPGAPAPSRLAAALLLLFLAENALLVGSAAARLSLYVAAYGLTEWRVAAFAWMGLVAAGLGLVALQGALGRGWGWLLRANALAALLVLYGWCFVDVPRLVADYDVAHCAEMKGGGPILDLVAMKDLGPEAVPAIDRFLLGPGAEIQRGDLRFWRARMAHDVRARMSDWRGWSLAGRRLAGYLDASGVAEPAVESRDDEGS